MKDAEVIPSTGDRKFDSTLKRVALGWKFRAARGPDNRPVAEMLATYGAATLELTINALLVALIVGIPLGLIAAA